MAQMFVLRGAASASVGPQQLLVAASEGNASRVKNILNLKPDLVSQMNVFQIYHSNAMPTLNSFASLYYLLDKVTCVALGYSAHAILFVGLCCMLSCCIF